MVYGITFWYLFVVAGISACLFLMGNWQKPARIASYTCNFASCGALYITMAAMHHGFDHGYSLLGVFILYWVLFVAWPKRDDTVSIIRLIYAVRISVPILCGLLVLFNYRYLV